jgi:hypothetical protein
MAKIHFIAIRSADKRGLLVTGGGGWDGACEDSQIYQLRCDDNCQWTAHSVLPYAVLGTVPMNVPYQWLNKLECDEPLT